MPGSPEPPAVGAGPALLFHQPPLGETFPHGRGSRPVQNFFQIRMADIAQSQPPSGVQTAGTDRAVGQNGKMGIQTVTAATFTLRNRGRAGPGKPRVPVQIYPASQVAAFLSRRYLYVGSEVFRDTLQEPAA